MPQHRILVEVPNGTGIKALKNKGFLKRFLSVGTFIPVKTVRLKNIAF